MYLHMSSNSNQLTLVICCFFGGMKHYPLTDYNRPWNKDPHKPTRIQWNVMFVLTNFQLLQAVTRIDSTNGGHLSPLQGFFLVELYWSVDFPPSWWVFVEHSWEIHCPKTNMLDLWKRRFHSWKSQFQVPAVYVHHPKASMGLIYLPTNLP